LTITTSEATILGSSLAEFFLIDLRTAERVAIPKLGARTQVFVKKALAVGTQNSATLPASFLEEMRKDAQLFRDARTNSTGGRSIAKADRRYCPASWRRGVCARCIIFAVKQSSISGSGLKNGGGDFGKWFDRKTPDGRDR